MLLNLPYMVCLQMPIAGFRRNILVIKQVGLSLLDNMTAVVRVIT